MYLQWPDHISTMLSGISPSPSTKATALSAHTGSVTSLLRSSLRRAAGSQDHGKGFCLDLSWEQGHRKSSCRVVNFCALWQEQVPVSLFEVWSSRFTFRSCICACNHTLTQLSWSHFAQNLLITLAEIPAGSSGWCRWRCSNKQFDTLVVFFFPT